MAPTSSRRKILQGRTDSRAGWVPVTRRHEANCLMTIGKPSRSFYFHPVSLPGSPLGLAQSGRQAWESAPVAMVEEIHKKLVWGGYAGSFTTGGEEVMVCFIFTCFEEPRVSLHPAPRAEGYEVRSPKLGAVLVLSLSPNPQHLRFYLQPTAPQAHPPAQGSGSPPQCMDTHP